MLDGKEDNQTRRAYLSDEERLAEDKETCKEQIAELEALYSAATDVMKERGNRMLELEAENQRLRDALPPPDRLRLLADWFDYDWPYDSTEVQDDLRRWADAIEQTLEKET